MPIIGNCTGSRFWFRLQWGLQEEQITVVLPQGKETQGLKHNIFMDLYDLEQIGSPLYSKVSQLMRINGGDSR